MSATLIGYARCSTGKQDLAVQEAALKAPGVPSDRIYTDHGLTGTNRSRPGLDQALAAAMQSVASKIGCSGETLGDGVRQAERDGGLRAGATSGERERIKAREREVRGCARRTGS